MEVALSRYLRDSVLRKTTEGREIIKIYYDWSPRLVRALEDEAALKDQLKKVLDKVFLYFSNFRKNCPLVSIVTPLSHRKLAIGFL